MLRLAPVAAVGTLAGPIFFGIAATLLPAFNFFPALGGASFSLAPWRMLADAPGLLQSCIISLTTGLAATFIALLIAAGFVAGWSHLRIFRPVQHLLSPLLSVPHAAAAFGLAFLLMPSGWLMRLLSPEFTGFSRPPDWLIINDPLGIALIVGLVAKELPFLMLVMLAALPQARPRQHAQVAVNLGYGRLAAFLHGVWPLIYPQTRLAVFAVIAYSCSVVDVALILGPTNPAPLAVRLLTWMNDPDLAVRFKASAGAVLQFAVATLALGIWIAGERLFAAAAGALRRSGRRANHDAIARVILLGLAIVAALAVFLGLFVLVLWSFAGYWWFPDALPDSVTLGSWARQLPAIGRPFAVTVATATTATVAALALVLASLEYEARTGGAGKRLLLFIYLPLLVPQISFVFGLQMFFLSINIDTSYLALALAHLVFVLPYVFLSLGDPWRAWDTRYGQAARALGATPNRVFWRIRMPMLLRTILIAAALGFAVSVGQYLPTLLIGSGRWPTVTTEAVALASGGNRRVIAIYAIVQLLLPLAAFAIAALIPAIVFANRRDMQAAN
jgi:putative thiamine transport system permease protein